MVGVPWELERRRSWVAMCLMKALTSGAGTWQGLVAALLPRLRPESESLRVFLLLSSRLWELDVDFLEGAVLLAAWEFLLRVGNDVVTRESLLTTRRRGFGVVG
jgi:hypothetical protein